MWMGKWEQIAHLCKDAGFVVLAVEQITQKSLPAALKVR